MNFKKIIMLVLVIFGPLSLFYFLSRGEYYFTNLPYLYDQNNHKPKSYEQFEMRDQDNNILNQDSLRNKYTVINYMDNTCPYDCKIDAKMMRLIVYKELMDASGFKDAIIITEVNDSVAANRKILQEILKVDGRKWRFVYSKKFSFFDLELNGTNPYTAKSIDYDTRYYFNMTMKIMNKMSEGVPMKQADRDKLNEYFEEHVYERSILILDRELKVRSYLNSSESIEFKRVMEELRLLKKEDAKSKRVLE